MKKLLLIAFIVSVSMLVSPAFAENVFEGTGVNITLDSNSPLDPATVNPSETNVPDDDPFTVTTSTNTSVEEAKSSDNTDATTEDVTTDVETEAKVIVKSGDSLSKIALRVYGDASRYREIVEANKDKYPSLAKNPDLIYAGWELDIPNSSSDNQAQAETSVVNLPSSDIEVSNDTESNSSAQIAKIPNFTTAEKISHLQESLDAANRALLGQGKVINVLTASVIRFLIDKNFLSEEEWMAMNPPVGYIWKIDSLGKVFLSPNSGSSSSTEIADETKDNSSDELAAKEQAEQEQAEQEEANKEISDKAEQERLALEAEKEKERLAKEAAELAAEQAKAEEAKKIQAEYSDFLSEHGIVDFRANSSEYDKAIESGFYLTVKGSLYDRGTKFFALYNAAKDSEIYLPLIQQELVEANERYAKLKNSSSNGKFMDSRDDDAEAALKVVNDKKAQLIKVWGMVTEALKQAEVDAENLRESSNAEEAQMRLEHYEALKLIFK